VASGEHESCNVIIPTMIHGVAISPPVAQLLLAEEKEIMID
jgi:hypothetical protein